MRLQTFIAYIFTPRLQLPHSFKNEKVLNPIAIIVLWKHCSTMKYKISNLLIGDSNKSQLFQAMFINDSYKALS